MIYSISYDLIKRKDYPELYKALKSMSGTHDLDSKWTVISDLSCDRLLDELKKHVDSDDKIIVEEVGKRADYNIPSSSRFLQSFMMLGGLSGNPPKTGLAALLSLGDTDKPKR